MQKRLLILGGSDFQIPFVKRAKEMGLFVGVVDFNVNAPAKKYADIFYNCSLKDKEVVLDYAKEFKPDGITVGMVDIANPTCAYLNKVLGLNGIDEETALKATNKYKMIQMFKEFNVPHPNFKYISSDEKNISIDMEYPLIVKPIDMAGSRGIFLVHNKEELNDAIKKINLMSNNGAALVEEYMDGPEVSVEVIVKNKIPFVAQVTDKTTTGSPHFAEIGHLQPSQLSLEDIKRIKEVAKQAAISIGLVNSLAHAEIKLTKNGPKMVEIGARCGGDGIAEQLIELSTGISFVQISIDIALGNDFIIPKNILEKSSCIGFIQSKHGILEKIDNVEQALNIPYIKDICITAKPGQMYHDVVDNSGRLGYVISQADNAKDAKEAVEKALNLIKVSYRG